MTEKSLLSKALGALKQGEIDIIAEDTPQDGGREGLIRTPLRHMQTCAFQFTNPDTGRTHIAALTVHASTREEIEGLKGVRIQYR